MSPRAKTILELLIFLILSFAPVVLLSLYASRAGGLAKAAWITPVGMLSPMLSAMLVQKLLARRSIKDLGFRIGRLYWWFLAPFLFALFITASLAASIGLTPSILASPVEIASSLQRASLLPHQLSMPQEFALGLAITVFAGPVLNLPIFLGEEVGWRGFMNSRLMLLFGRSGLLGGGALWALWHLPIVLLGHNYPNHPWLGMAVWVPICCALNILLAAIKKASGSIFPCALSHGMINQLAMFLVTFTIVEARYLDWLHGPAGLIGLVLLAGPATLVYLRAFPRVEG